MAVPYDTKSPHCFSRYIVNRSSLSTARTWFTSHHRLKTQNKHGVIYSRRYFTSSLRVTRCWLIKQYSITQWSPIVSGKQRAIDNMIYIKLTIRAIASVSANKITINVTTLQQMLYLMLQRAKEHIKSSPNNRGELLCTGSLRVNHLLCVKWRIFAIAFIKVRNRLILLFEFF